MSFLAEETTKEAGQVSFTWRKSSGWHNSLASYLIRIIMRSKTDNNDFWL
jgi:hypothetical protein